MRAFRINKSHARFNCPALFIRFSNDIFLSFSLSFRVKVFRVARQILGMKFQSLENITYINYTCNKILYKGEDIYLLCIFYYRVIRATSPIEKLFN